MSDIPPPEAPPDETVEPHTPVTDERELIERRLIAESKHADDIDDVLATVAATDFATGSHRAVWEAIQAVHLDGGQVDLLSVTLHMEQAGTLHHIGGVVALDRILAPDGYSGSALSYAKRLRVMADRDRLAQVGRDVAGAAARGEQVDLAELAEKHNTRPNMDRGIETPWDVIEQITDRHTNRDAHHGRKLGWEAIDQLYRVEPGLLSIVTGIPSSGKSSWVDASLIRLADSHDWRFAMFSPENAPTEHHVLSLCSIRSGRPWESQSMAELHPHINWVHDHFTWIKSTDQLDLDEVLRRAEVIRRRTGIEGLVIDPWNDLGADHTSNLTETQQIRDALTKVRRWGRRHAVHVWIVAHPKKQEKRADSTYAVPTMYDISGSSTWFDKADMGVVVHRDKLKPGPVQIQVVKVRFREHGRLGIGRLHFDIPTGRYFDLARGSL